MFPEYFSFFSFAFFFPSLSHNPNTLTSKTFTLLELIYPHQLQVCRPDGIIVFAISNSTLVLSSEIIRSGRYIKTTAQKVRTNDSYLYINYIILSYLLAISHLVMTQIIKPSVQILLHLSMNNSYPNSQL